MVTKEYFDNLQKEMANRSVESLVEEFNQQENHRDRTFEG